MADMTIVISAVDRATAAITKVKDSLHGLEKTTARTAQTITTSGDRTASAFTRSMVAYKGLMRVMSGSKEFSDLTSSISTLAGSTVDATLKFIGLGSAISGIKNAAAFSTPLAQMETINKLLERARAEASKPARLQIIRPHEVEELEAALASLNEQMMKINHADVLGVKHEDLALLKAMGQERMKQVTAQRAAAIELSTAAMGPTNFRSEELAAASVSYEVLKLSIDALNDAYAAGMMPLAVYELAIDKAREEMVQANVVHEAMRAGLDLDTAMLIAAAQAERSKAETTRLASEAEVRATERSIGIKTRLLGIIEGIGSSIKGPFKEAIDSSLSSLSTFDEYLSRINEEFIASGVNVTAAENKYKRISEIFATIGNSSQAMKDTLFELQTESFVQQFAADWGLVGDEVDYAREAFKSLLPAVRDIDTQMKANSVTLEDIAGSIGNSFADAFESVIAGTMSVGAAFAQMVASILRDVARMIVVKAIMSLITGTPFSLLGIEGSQHGGTVTAGVPRLVGEAGPEVFVPHQSGYVNSNGALGGGGTVVNFNINAVDGASVAAMLRREKDTIKQVIAQAVSTDGRFKAALA